MKVPVGNCPFPTSPGTPLQEEPELAVLEDAVILAQAEYLVLLGILG